MSGDQRKAPVDTGYDALTRKAAAAEIKQEMTEKVKEEAKETIAAIAAAPTVAAAVAAAPAAAAAAGIPVTAAAAAVSEGEHAWYPAKGFVRPASFKAEHLGGVCHYKTGKDGEDQDGCSSAAKFRRTCTTTDMVKAGSCNLLTVDVPRDTAKGAVGSMYEALDIGTKIKLQLYKARTNKAHSESYAKNARALAAFGKFSADEMNRALRFLTDPERRFLKADISLEKFKKEYADFDKEEDYYNEIETGANSVKVVEFLLDMSTKAAFDRRGL